MCAARLSPRPLALSDLFSVMVPADDRHPADIRAIAIHEAGHAIVAHPLGGRGESVSIIPEGESGGYTLIHYPTVVPLWQDFLDEVAVTLGGRAADIVLGKGANAGAEGDLARGTAILVGAYDKQWLLDELAVGSAFGPILRGISGRRWTGN